MMGMLHHLVQARPRGAVEGTIFGVEMPGEVAHAAVSCTGLEHMAEALDVNRSQGRSGSRSSPSDRVRMLLIPLRIAHAAAGGALSARAAAVTCCILASARL